MKPSLLYILVCALAVVCACTPAPKTPEIDPRVADLLAKMTLEEKAGQLHFVVGDLFNTGPTVRTTESSKFDEDIRAGRITGLFNVHGAAYLHKLQKLAVEESRLGIPLLIGADVIHGFKTVFPIPLGEAASWDLEAIELGSRVAARESAAAGIHLTFAPMVDISRDARWGRSAEGAGEDPYLGSLIAAARVRGFQGNSLADPSTVAACVKHFAAYGAAEAGRDYNTVDMSDQLLRDVYLPPFKAAIDAGAATLMTSFNELNGVPASGHTYLLRDILRGEWGFKGTVISDWQSLSEMIIHGYSADSVEATIQGLKAGTDMDMMADLYLKFLPKLVREGQISEALVDEAVARVLQLKFDLGLFDNPYQYNNVEVEKAEIRKQENLDAAFDMARKSVVLLKNEKAILPMSAATKRIAVIGPLAANKADMNGTWSFFGEEQHPISIEEGIRQYAPEGTEVRTAQGCLLYQNDLSLLAEAEALARWADVVVLAIGESAVMNGEGASRADIRLPGSQQLLVEKVAATGTPVVALVSSGRAMVLTEMEPHAHAILAMWALGSEAGRAIGSVLFGEYNPSGKLPVTFPRAVGQVPLYYNHKNTGRPFEGDFHQEKLEDRVYRSRYRDVPNTPLYPFGYGLSYTQFEYGAMALSHPVLAPNGTLTISVEVKNAGKIAGEEIVQLYIRDRKASVTRPVLELKGFQKMAIAPGQTVRVAFELTPAALGFHRADGTFGWEAGEFDVMVGPNSRDLQRAELVLK
jgi:beta-glucosidase